MWVVNECCEINPELAPVDEAVLGIAKLAEAVLLTQASSFPRSRTKVNETKLISCENGVNLGSKGGTIGVSSA